MSDLREDADMRALRVLVLVGVLMLVWPAAAHAAPLDRCMAAAAQVLDQWPPEYVLVASLDCRPEPADGLPPLLGSYDEVANAAVAYTDIQPMTVTQYALVFQHELGHAWDAHRLTTADRARFTAATGLEWDRETYADVFMLALSPLEPDHGWYGELPRPPESVIRVLQRAALLPR